MQSRISAAKRRAMQMRRQAKTTYRSAPAPIGGWNTRDSLDSIPPTDATILDNWLPTTGGVEIRGGYADHGATGMGGSNIDTLVEYHSGATRQLLACANGNIYNATASGAATSLGSGFTVNNWQTINFSGRVFFFNGTDAPQDWNGSTLSTTAWTGPSSNNDLIGANVFKNRIFTWESESQSFWYASVNAVTGALTEFPLSRVSQFGGNLVAMETWTFDGGSGTDDYAVFLMSSGQVVVYQGSDPGDASNWSLVGVYQISEPVGIRCMVKHRGDLVVITKSDVVNLSEVLQAGTSTSSSKLAGAIEGSVADYRSVFGWEITIHRDGGLMVMNIPADNGGTEYYQYVINLRTGAACRFTEINARCWAVYNGNLYFGGTDGAIYKYGDGVTADAGTAITADALQAWYDFGYQGRKRFTGIRPIIQSVGSISYGIGLGFDFVNPRQPAQVTTSPAASPWNTSYWNITYWQPETVSDLSWILTRGSGEKSATRLRISSTQTTLWQSTSYRFEPGQKL